jgi:predicted AlkP superfamily phosphohydrolase/phosphomutase
MALVAALAPLAGCSGRGAEADSAAAKVIILGFDGMDYELTRKMIDAGELPNFARLEATGGRLKALGTAIPPQSPVAWSDFISGADSGTHGIFDFIHRDPKTMQPYMSTSSSKATSMWTLGRYRFPKNPFESGGPELLRRGQAFWTVLEERGVETSVLRMPANYPPSGTATRELSGMGTPDVLGGYGTFTVLTSDPFALRDEDVDGGTMVSVEVKKGRVDAKLLGPESPFLKTPTPLTADIVAYVDPVANAAKVVLGEREVLLAAGEWSEWIPFSFPIMPGQSLPAITRLYLRSVTPHIELYVSPPNIDPSSPYMPISTPGSYAGHLCKCTGYFFTQGMPEATGPAKEGVFTLAEFLAQAKLAGDENVAQYHFVLSEFERGLLFYYFGNTDLVAHIAWRAMDPGHPAYDPVVDGPHADVVPATYRQMDDVVGYTLEHMPQDALVVVMSDHGFASWRRVFHLNSWLRDHGYLTVKSAGKAGSNYSNVDWSQTRAYGLGINGLYLNLKGREAQGIVEKADKAALIAELKRELLAVVDPATGLPAITKVYVSAETYSDGGSLDIGPDIQVGYAEGTRGADESAIGELMPEAMYDNVKRWSGDHCMDHEAVPGILLTSRPLKKPATALKNLAAAILAEYGVDHYPDAH